MKIRAALLCDDVRVEKNGKQMLIGVYGSDIAVTKFPANLRLVPVLIGEATSTEESEIKFEITLGAAILSQGNGKTRSERPGAVVLPLPAFMISLKSSDDLKIRIETDGVWEEVCSLPVRLFPSSSTAQAKPKS